MSSVSLRGESKIPTVCSLNETKRNESGVSSNAPKKRVSFSSIEVEKIQNYKQYNKVYRILDDEETDVECHCKIF